MISPCHSADRGRILANVAAQAEIEGITDTVGVDRDSDLTDEALVETFRRRTKRLAIAPWLWHIGLLEFSRYAHKSSGQEAARIFNLLRLRDVALVLGAYTLVPSGLLGAIGFVTDALAVDRLAQYIPPVDIAKDRSIGSFPIAVGWALEFNSPQASGPLAAIIPGLFHTLFAVKHKVAPAIAGQSIAREVISGGALIYVFSELSHSLRMVIRQELLAIQGARRSSKIAAERRSKARLWLVETHTRLNALAAARWAVDEVRDEPGPAQFIELTAAEENRLREMFESGTIPLSRVTERIKMLREVRELSTSISANDIDGLALHEEADAVIEWLIEAVCPFATGHLSMEIRVSGAEAQIRMDADRFPSEIMLPFKVQNIGSRQRIEGTLNLGLGTQK